MLIAVSAAEETLRLCVPVMLLDVADTPAVPTDLAVAKPVALIATMPGDELTQCTDVVRSCVLPSV
jgi:hypothetical protein